MDEPDNLLKTIVSNPGIQGLALGTMALVYKFIRIIKADSREDSLQKQIDKWHTEVVAQVDDMKAEIAHLSAENVKLQVHVAELTTTLEAVRTQNAALLLRLRRYEPSPLP